MTKANFRAQNRFKMDGFSWRPKLPTSVTAILLPNPSFYKGESVLHGLLESLGKFKELKNIQSNLMVMAFSVPAMHTNGKG